MKPLLKIMLVLFSVFALVFILAKNLGILSWDQIEAGLLEAKNLSGLYVASLVIALLFADLFIAVPTLTITIFSGYFLGFLLGSLTALVGVFMAGTAAYFLSQKYGYALLERLMKNKQQRQEAIETFQQHGFMMIIIARAMPILPEVTACLSGLTGMKFRTFLLAWLLGSLPYILIAAYAGSISSIHNPKPAIYTGIALLTSLWLTAFIYHRSVKQKRSADQLQ